MMELMDIQVDLVQSGLKDLTVILAQMEIPDQ